MKIPSMPQRGGSIEHSVREIIAFIRASRITSVRGGLLRESPNGTTIQIDGGRGGSATSSVSAAVIQPLTLVDSRPSYIPAGASLAAGHKSVWLTWGFCNDRLPTNWSQRVDVPLSGEYTKYIYLKVTFATTAASPDIAVTSCEWVTLTDFPTQPAWGEDGARPAYWHIFLGMIQATPVTVAEGEDPVSTINIMNFGGGSIHVSEHVSAISQDGYAGFKYKQAFSYQRYLQG